MDIGSKDWKDLNKSNPSTRSRLERVEDQKIQAELNRPTVNEFLKGMTGETGKTEQPAQTKVVEKPAPASSGKAEERGQRQGGKDVDIHRENAEARYQEARGQQKALNSTILKPADIAQEKLPRGDNAARPEPSPDKRGQPTSDIHNSVRQTGESAGRQIRDPKGHALRQGSGQAITPENSTQQKGFSADNNNEDSRIRQSKDDTGAASDRPVDGKKAAATEGAKVARKGERDAVAERQGALAGFDAGHRARDAGCSKSSRRTSREKDRAEVKTGGASRTARTDDTRAATAELSSLLSGKYGGESPFDIEPKEKPEPATATVREPVEWSTGIELFTEEADSANVRLAAAEHEQRTIKPRKEKVEYENWDLSDKPIRERFVLETSQMLEFAMQIIRAARLPKDPRGFGTAC